MLTARGGALLVGGVGAWLAGRFFGIAELYAVGIAAGVVVGLGVLFVRQTTSAIAVRRILRADRVVAGGRIEARLELRNDARVPSPTLLVAEALPDQLWPDHQPDPGEARFVLRGLGHGRIATAAYAAEATARGRYTLGPASIRLRDPFGVAERVRRYESIAELIVYPRIRRLQPHQVSGSHMGTGSSDKRRVLVGGDEFYTMREYVSGDDLRMVHWPSTAHRSKLMVRQMEQPWQAHATVYLDSRRVAHTAGPEGTLERAVSVAASVVFHLADREYAIRLVTDADTGRGGPQSWEDTLDRLAVLEATEHAGLGPSAAATRGSEGLMVAVLGVPPGRHDPAHHPDLRALYGVRGYGQRAAFIVADAQEAERAERTAGLLTAGGWRAGVVLADDDLPELWQRLLRPSVRAMSGGSAGPEGSA